jgi:hypothetical protein
MYNDLILMVHKLVAPLQQQTADHIMSSHGIVNVSHVTDQLSSIDGVTNAIDVQVATNKGDLEQEIVIISQLHVINVQ